MDRVCCKLILKTDSADGSNRGRIDTGKQRDDARYLAATVFGVYTAALYRYEPLLPCQQA